MTVTMTLVIHSLAVVGWSLAVALGEHTSNPGYFGNRERVPYSTGINLTCQSVILGESNVTWFGEGGQNMELLSKTSRWQYRVDNNYLFLLPPADTAVTELIVYCVGHNTNVEHVIELYKDDTITGNTASATTTEHLFYSDGEAMKLECNKSVLERTSPRRSVTWYANGTLTMAQLMKQTNWQALESDGGHVLTLVAPEVPDDGPLDLVCMGEDGTENVKKIGLTRIDPENLTLFGSHDTTTCSVPVYEEGQLALTCLGTSRYPIGDCTWYSSNSRNDHLKTGPDLVLGRDAPLHEGRYWCQCMVGETSDILRYFQVTSGYGIVEDSLFCRQLMHTTSATSSVTSPLDTTIPNLDIRENTSRFPSKGDVSSQPDIIQTAKNLPGATTTVEPGVNSYIVSTSPDDGYRSLTPTPAHRNVGGTKSTSTTASTDPDHHWRRTILVAVLVTVACLLVLTVSIMVHCFRRRRRGWSVDNPSDDDAEAGNEQDEVALRETVTLMDVPAPGDVAPTDVPAPETVAVIVPDPGKG